MEFGETIQLYRACYKPGISTHRQMSRLPVRFPGSMPIALDCNCVNSIVENDSGDEMADKSPSGIRKFVERVLPGRRRTDAEEPIRRPTAGASYADMLRKTEGHERQEVRDKRTPDQTARLAAFMDAAEQLLGIALDPTSENWPEVRKGLHNALAAIQGRRAPFPEQEERSGTAPTKIGESVPLTVEESGLAKAYAILLDGRDMFADATKPEDLQPALSAIVNGYMDGGMAKRAIERDASIRDLFFQEPYLRETLGTDCATAVPKMWETKESDF